MTNPTPLSAATATATIAAYQQLQSDLAAIPNQDLSNATSQKLATIQNDVVQYYSVQSGERGYAAMAANVVANSKRRMGKRSVTHRFRPVSLDATHITVDGRDEPITPGMAVTAEIKTGKRRVISYLLSPVMKYAHEGMSER